MGRQVAVEPQHELRRVLALYICDQCGLVARRATSGWVVMDTKAEHRCANLPPCSKWARKRVRQERTSW